MKNRKLLSLVAACLLLASCSGVKAEERVLREVSENAVNISLSDEGVKVNGADISREETAAVYLSNDIIYYEDGTDFTYGEGTADDMHTREEASSHSVINITKPGDYILSGKLSKGQIAVDLGEEAEDNPQSVVTLVMNGADISCSVAPAVIFYDVYECGDDDEETASTDVDTSAAGANIIIADGTENTINGSYVARIYKSVELNEAKTEVVDSEKLHKYDAAVYSRMSMNVYGGEAGNGILNINAENEGLDTELHLTIHGGNININSGNDGINTNEDGVSVTTIKSGELNIVVNGKTGEGDGIDSNGWLIIEGGTVNAYAYGESEDSGVDADNGVQIRGGNVIATGNMLDRMETQQNYAAFSFSAKQEGGKNYTLKNGNGEDVITLQPQNAFSQMFISGADLSEGEYTLWYEGEKLSTVSGGMGRGERPGGMPQRPNGGKEFPEGQERPEPPKGGEWPNFEDMKENVSEREPGERTMPEKGEERPEGGRGGVPMEFDESRLKDTLEIKKGENSFFVVTEK